MNPITINGDWIQSVSESIPDHSTDIKESLEFVMKQSPLTPVDTHAIAYVAALTSSNGGLAFEIEHNGPLFTDDKVREAAKSAASLMGMINTWYSFVESIDVQTEVSSKLTMKAFGTSGGVTEKQFEMYALAASIVANSAFCIQKHYDNLFKLGMSHSELQHVARVASVVNAIGKIAL